MSDLQPDVPLAPIAFVMLPRRGPGLRGRRLPPGRLPPSVGPCGI